jgi:hypothetical protein
MRRAALFAALCGVIILALASLTSAFVGGPSREAVWVSASLAFVLQMIAFTVVRMLPPEQVMIGWGLGSILRLMSVVLYGVFVAKVWRAPVAPALLSFVAFLFVTTILEPAFLKR